MTTGAPRGAPDRRAPWITLEGIEGTGKSTQIERLHGRLEAAGRASVRTREPGGTALGGELRRILLACTGSAIHPVTELLLYAADRAQHVTDVVLPALAHGTVVLCDRHLDATLAYQGHGRELGVAIVHEVHRVFPLDLRPDRTILLDLDPRAALERAHVRDSATGRTVTEGRFEAEPLAFHVRVREGYLALAAEDPARIHVVDAAGGIDDVERRVVDALGDILPELRCAP